MKKMFVILLFFLVSILLQWHFEPVINKDFISSLLIVFSMFFGFYITSFAVFSTSKYLYKLYKIQDQTDNRKTLLDNLIEEFKWPAYFLLFSIVYLITVYIIIENKFPKFIYYCFYILWGIIVLNIFYIFRTIDIFIKITRQSVKE